MPYKEKKDQVAWRNSRTSNYMKWLYAKRKLHRETAALFEQTLLLIARTTAVNNASAEAEAALHNAHVMRKKVGNRFDHANDKPYWKES